MVNLGPLSDDIDLNTGASRRCHHSDAEPVRLLITGEIVAWLCLACDEQLPADFTPYRHELLAGAMSPDAVRHALGMRALEEGSHG